MRTTRPSLKIGRLFGIDLHVDPSWLVVFALVIWSLTALFSRWHPTWGLGLGLLVATGSALAFFLSILLHELAHSLVARLYGIPVRDITLHMFGGVSNIEREPPTPRAEFLIAIVGPIASVALGIGMIVAASIAFGVTNGGASGDVTFEGAAEAMAHMGPLTTLLMWLGPVNVLVGLFNLIPGFPLDGGRILRSLLWFGMHDLRRATLLSTTIGQIVGWGFVVLGVLMALGIPVPFFGVGVFPGLWLGLIGLFLRNAAAQHRMGVEIESALSGLHVSDVMRTRGPWVSADTTVRSLVADWFRQEEDVSFPVFDETLFVGVVSATDVKGIAAEDWDRRTARDVMATTFPVVAPHDDALDVLKQFGSSNVQQIPVVEDHALVGMVYQRDLLRWLEAGATRPSSSPRSNGPSSFRPKHA